MRKTGTGFTTQLTNSRKYWKTKKKPTFWVGLNFWQPQPDSNWCSRLERAVSWASRRWGQNCHSNDFIQIKRWQIITGAAAFVKAKYHRAIFFVILPFLFLVRRQPELRLHRLALLRQRRLLQQLLRSVRPVGKRFLCRRHFSASNDHLLNHMFQPLS